MVIVNFRIAAEVAETGDWAASVTHLLEGRAAALFVVLAGVGISLARPSAGLMARRGLFLLAIGLLNQTIFEADILHYYGVYFIAAIGALALSPRGLLVATAGVMIVSFIALIGLDYEAGWNWETLEYADFWTFTGFLRNLFYNGWHPVFPWLSFLLFGMFLGRLPLAHPNIQKRLLLVGIFAAVLIIGSSVFLSQDPEIAEIAGLSPVPPGPFYVLAGIATSSAAIGAVLLLTPLFSRWGLTAILGAAGRQTLTLYVVHILIGMGTLEAFGRLDGSLPSPMIFIISIGFCGGCLLYAYLWNLAFSRGPLETLMRRITS